MVPLSARWTGVRQTNADARPGDLIVMNPWFVGLSFARYYRGGVPLGHDPIEGRGSERSRIQ